MTRLRWGCWLIAGPLATLPVLLIAAVAGLNRVSKAGGLAAAWGMGGLAGALIGSVISIIIGIMLIRRSGV